MDRHELHPERYTQDARSLLERARLRAEGDRHVEVSPLHLFAELVTVHGAVFRDASVDPAELLAHVDARLSQSAQGDPPARLDGSMQELLLRVERIARAPEGQVAIAHVAQALFEKRAVQTLPGAVIATSAFAQAAPEGAPAEVVAPAPLPERPRVASAALPASPPRYEGPDRSSPLFQRVAAELRTPTMRSSWVTLVFLVLSLGLFVVSLGESSLQTIAMIVGVLLFHEAGHWVGMRLFGYRDVRMFFIPFFGAAVSGDPDGVAGWKRGVVLLLGPVPGILLACILAVAFRGTHIAWMKTLVLTLASVNALNLLPFEPLDGGRLVHLVLASRARFLDVVSLVAAAAGLAWLAVRLEANMFFVLAGLTFLGVVRRVRVLRAAKAVRLAHPTLPVSIRDATDEQLADILARVQAFTPKPADITDARVRLLAAGCRQVYGRATSVAPRWSVSLGLGAAQLVGFAFGALALVLVVGRATAGGPLEPLTQSKSLPDGSVTVHYPASFSAKIVGADNAALMVSRTAGGHAESVSLTVGMPTTPDARRTATALATADGARVAIGESDQCLGKPGVEVSGTFTSSKGLTFADHGCVFVRGPRVIYARYIVHPAIEELERPQLRAILDAVEYAP